MRCCSLFLLALCILTCRCVLAQQTKTLAVRPNTGVLAGKTAYTNSYAILIGVGEYASLPKDKHLDFAAKDAVDMRDVLIRSYGFPAENVTVLLDAQATRANIEAALSSLADDRVKPGDRVLVYFSGHGQTVKLQDGGEMGFLIPYDAKVDLAHPENRSGYLATCLRMDSIWGYLEASAAKHRLLLADACFGGLLIRGKVLNGERPNRATIASLLERPALQAMTAGASDEEAQEDPKLGHSTYTFKLLEELKAQAATPDTVFLASELAATLKTSVGNLTNARQTPQFGNHNQTEGDFVFVTTEPAPVPSAAPLLNPTSTPEPKTVPHFNPSGIANGHVYRNSRPDNPAIGDVWINLKDGAEMVFIPGGEFTMGSNDHDDEKPPHSVRLTKGYWMYRTAVTVGQYEKFCQDTGRQMPPEPVYGTNHVNPDWKNKDHPIVNISWNDAMAYCQWAGASLPTEAQWERGARGPQGLRFPWGNTFDSTRLWSSKTEFGDAGGTSAVGRFPANGFGLYDMAGNVWQWCLDCYDAKFYASRLAEQPDPVNTVGDNVNGRVLRGGSWNLIDESYFRCSLRFKYTPTETNFNFGFRCVLQ